MARTFTPNDAHAIVNLVMKELTGQDAQIQQVNSSNFVSTGEKILTQYPMENVYNALSIPLLRTLIAARSADDELLILNAVDSGMYSSRLRKISYLSRFALPSGSFNTNLYTNLAPGFTAGQNEDAQGTPQSTKSQWEQNPVIPVELQFGGSSVWDHGITWYKDQAKNAFTDEASFLRFWEGALVENANDIKSEKNAFRRMILLNHIAGMVDLTSSGTTVVNLTAAYNAKFRTTYTSEQLRTTYLKEFLKFFTSTFKLYSKNLKKRSMNYHVNISKTVNGVTYNLLRHTPYDRQRVILYEPLFMDAEAMVLPEIFRPEYLDLETQYEGVTWWQNENEPSKISVIPAITDYSTGVQTAGAAVALDYVVGLIFDEDAIMTDFQLDDTNTTPLEARKRFRNTWFTMARNGLNDHTEKAVLFIMAD